MVTGIYTSADDEELIYAGPANVQAGGLMAANRRATGQADLAHDGEMYLPREERAAALRIQPEDIVHVAYQPIRDGDTVVSYGADARVVFVRPEDRAVLLRYS